MNPETISRLLPRILPHVEKPGRYTGGELNQSVKDWDSTPVRVALLFPDIYEIGMSNLGLSVLYEIINAQPDALAERVYLPWDDMEAAMRREGIPLFSLENRRPVADFDLLGITLPYESLYTNALHALDLAGIPLRAADRGERHPLVVGGGHTAFNPEPVADFFDAFAVGESEELILDLLDILRRSKKEGNPRPAMLERMARVWGMYVPSFYTPDYRGDGTIARITPRAQTVPGGAGIPLPVVKRIVPRLPPPPLRPVVPYLETVHNRYAIEIMRGCTRGCRFCQAGYVTRPIRERSVAQIVASISAALGNTGYEEVALLSLSSSDHSHITELVRALGETFGGAHLRISLPSLRIETVSVDLVEALRGNRSGNFTLAPEAATESMRAVLNKPIAARQLIETVREIYSRKWTTVKLYFMIGHPRETADDVRAIAELARAVLAEGRRSLGRRAEVHAGVSTLVPKAHTPFQWLPMDSREQIQAKQDLLRRELRGPGLRLDLTPPEVTLHEARLARGDRRMGGVIERAWRGGARFDAWSERFQPAIWYGAFEQARLDPAFYSHRERAADEIFPWDHISAGVRKEYLRQEYEASLAGRTRGDCREECFGCGILPAFRELRDALPLDEQFCPTARPK
ncbi:MAG: TIGR03960 family B12-binding radical SAM protein [Anaerolineales bacterium]|nr:TIGR03960 family B12-binding radical SAM protein [Anaerolineales bacterium]